jgi:hypothetical protein
MVPLRARRGRGKRGGGGSALERCPTGDLTIYYSFTLVPALLPQMFCGTTWCAVSDRTWFTVLTQRGPTGRDAIALAEGQGKDAKDSQAPKGRDLATMERSRPFGAQTKSPFRTLACGQGFRIWALQAPESNRHLPFKADSFAGTRRTAGPAKIRRPIGRDKLSMMSCLKVSTMS